MTIRDLPPTPRDSRTVPFPRRRGRWYRQLGISGACARATPSRPRSRRWWTARARAAHLLARTRWNYSVATDVCATCRQISGQPHFDAFLRGASSTRSDAATPRSPCRRGRASASPPTTRAPRRHAALAATTLDEPLPHAPHVPERGGGSSPPPRNPPLLPDRCGRRRVTRGPGSISGDRGTHDRDHPCPPAATGRARHRHLQREHVRRRRLRPRLRGVRGPAKRGLHGSLASTLGRGGEHRVLDRSPGRTCS